MAHKLVHGGIACPRNADRACQHASNTLTFAL